MKLDLELAIRNLRRALDAFEDVQTDSDHARFIARMYEITRLLWHDPLVMPVTSEIAKEFSDLHVDARKQVWASDSVSKDLAAKAADGVEALVKQVPLDQQRETIFAVTELAHTSTVEGKQYRPVELLRRIAEPEFVGQDNFLVAFNDAVSRIHKFLINAHHFFENERQLLAIRDTIEALHQRVQETTGLAANLTGYVEALCLKDSISRLRSFDSWMFSLSAAQLAGEDYRQVPNVTLLRECTWAVKQISTQVLHRLSAASGSFHALRRTKTYFEHFARAELIEYIRTGGGHPEDRIQERLDRFLFEEGVFPITHCSASGGFLDTFVASEALPRLEAAEGNEIPPMLIELKQEVAIGSKPNEASIKDAVVHALGQASTYAAHVAANPRWSALRVYAVVFYSGDQRFHSLRDDVVLVYLGEKKPSAGSRLLDLT